MIAKWVGWDVWTLGTGSPARRPDRLVEEEPVHLVVGESLKTVLMATPGDERELAAGFAVTMGWVESESFPVAPVWEAEGRRAIFDPSIRVDETQEVKAAGGGPLGPLDVLPGKTDSRMDCEIFLGLTEAMSKAQLLYRETGATHAVGLFSFQGELMALAEDVGRHNALDKAVGKLWLDGRLSSAAAAAFSGRMSLEMVLKAARAGLGLLVGVSAPTAAAVRMADRLGLTLGGFSRGGKVNVYTHPERLLHEGKPMQRV